MPKVTSEAAKRAWMTYKETMGLTGELDEEKGVKAMQMVLEELAHMDRGEARNLVIGHGQFTTMIFDGPNLLALGEHLTPQEARNFLEDVWGSSPRSVEECPRD